MSQPKPSELTAKEAPATRQRARTLSRKEMSKLLRQERGEGPDPELQAALAELEALRPRKRSDCEGGPRPCPWISCKFNLFVDVNPRSGSVKFNFPDKDLDEVGDTCALDVADRGGITLEETGTIMNLTRERVRQLETRGLLRLRVISEGGQGPSADDIDDD